MSESRHTKKLEQKVFELTLALYRVTDFFPPGEALRKHLREKANEIFGGISEYRHGLDQEREAVVMLGKIESVKGYLQIARSMRFVKPINLTVLEREYAGLASILEAEIESLRQEAANHNNNNQHTLERTPEPAAHPEALHNIALSTWNDFTVKEPVAEKPARPALQKKIVAGEMNDRQRKIMAYIESVAKAKISDFFTVFHDISSKTIQRDLQDLVARNALKKEGEKRWTTYYINNALPR